MVTEYIRKTSISCTGASKGSAGSGHRWTSIHTSRVSRARGNAWPNGMEWERAVAGEAYIAWFEELRRSPDYDVQELMALPGLELVAELSDGVILRVSK